MITEQSQQYRQLLQCMNFQTSAVQFGGYCCTVRAKDLVSTNPNFNIFLPICQYIPFTSKYNWFNGQLELVHKKEITKKKIKKKNQSFSALALKSVKLFKCITLMCCQNACSVLMCLHHNHIMQKAAENSSTESSSANVNSWQTCLVFPSLNPSGYWYLGTPSEKRLYGAHQPSLISVLAAGCAELAACCHHGDLLNS